MAAMAELWESITTVMVGRWLRAAQVYLREGPGFRVLVLLAVASGVSFASFAKVAAGDDDADRLKELQTAYVVSASEKAAGLSLRVAGAR